MPKPSHTLQHLFGLGVVALALQTPACRTVPSGAPTSRLAEASPVDGFDDYESVRVIGLQPTKTCAGFKPTVGVEVTVREAGEARAGKIRVLADNPASEIYVVGAFNAWGEKKTAADRLKPTEGGAYYEGRMRDLKHGMEYGLLVDGRQLIDPAAALYTAAPKALRSVFWDFDRPGAYKMRVHAVDLRGQPLIIAESEVYGLAARWPRGREAGPTRLDATYRFVADSGLVDELKRQGYDAIEFLPFSASVDGDHWHFRYQVYGGFAADARYGTPDDFAAMVDAFNRAGIAVIMDAVVGHYPYQGNGGARDLATVGIHNWKRSDGKALFGDVKSPWDTHRYDYANPHVRRFLADAVVSTVCRYEMGGIRFDNLDGIRLYDGPGGGGPEFLQELTTELRARRPDLVLIGEMVSSHPPVLRRLDKGGFGFNYRTHSDFFDVLKDNMQKQTQEVDMVRLRQAIRGPWDWQEAPRLTYATKHDEAANRRDGATGAYLATLLAGGGSYQAEKKTMAFGSLALLASAAYLDMPQMRLLQQGSFNDKPEVAWDLRAREGTANVYRYFGELSKLVRGSPAFAIQNFTTPVENHIDMTDGRRIVSLVRRDGKTGKTYVALINLSHVAQARYRFGIDHAGPYSIVLDADADRFGGTGELEKRNRSGMLVADGASMHGKATSIQVPYLAPYATVLLERQ